MLGMAPPGADHAAVSAATSGHEQSTSIDELDRALPGTQMKATAEMHKLFAQVTEFHVALASSHCDDRGRL
jgi:hypothetical protein